MMATPGELVRTVAAALGIPEPTVTQHDRNLAAAGLRTTSGRGPSAAKVTARDAAHLLTAVLGSEQVKDSAATVIRYKAAPLLDPGIIYGFVDPEAGGPIASLKAKALTSLPETHTFIDLLTTLIEMAAEGSLKGFQVQVRIGWPMTHAHVRMFSIAGPAIVHVDYDGPGKWPPVQRSATISDGPILHIGALLGGRVEPVPDGNATDFASRKIWRSLRAPV